MITMSQPYGRQGKPQMIQYLPTFFSVIYSAVYFFLLGGEKRGAHVWFLPLLGRNTYGYRHRDREVASYLSGTLYCTIYLALCVLI
ncbi:hypothetical protein CTAM01_07714 [Colletotrichum tamarilloi]|uniref:Uncharacterized protein n=1 Tax=Colletotrichum tamarilloi TaxID=1209934 RepID=A0ABQ9R7U1_9PEZI|nr:uncharacterized protein CTAM01_07714 [Colletotrichum tamarilloi]KAK1497444.1 hypothetical protein CTAM01_07714 [Colletotrichum tamarilloi]